MNDFLRFFSSNDTTIIIGLMITIILLMSIILIIDMRARKKEIEESDNFNLELEENKQNEIVNEETGEIKKIKYVETNSEIEKTKAKLELENLKAELAKEEEEKQKESTIIPIINEETVIKENKLKETVVEPTEIVHPEEKIEISQETIKEETPIMETMEDQVNRFEDEQEEKAIISVAELTKKANELYDSEEIIKYEDEGNEPISIQELEALYQASKTEDIAKAEPIIEQVKEEKTYTPTVNTVHMPETFDLKEKPQVTTKFSNSPIISPVYGINMDEKDKSLDNINLEQTANLEKLNEELKKVNEFLVALKELKNKLQ